MSSVKLDPASHTYSLDGVRVPGVTQVLAPLNDFGILPLGTLEGAAVRGRAVHKATEEHDREPTWKPAVEKPWRPEWVGPVPVNSSLVPYLDAWKQFLADTKFEIHAIEQQVYSRKYNYAGVLDRLGVLNGKRCVIDIKTTAAISPQVGVQLAAYQQAVNEELVAPTRTKIGGYHKRFACQLRRNGTYRLEEFTDAADWSVFLALLTVHNWRLRYRKEKSWKQIPTP